MRGRLSAHILSLHNRSGVAGSHSSLTRPKLKYKVLVQIRHLFIYLFIIYLFITIIISPYSRVHQISWTGMFWAPVVRVLPEELGISEYFRRMRAVFSSAAFWS